MSCSFEKRAPTHPDHVFPPSLPPASAAPHSIEKDEGEKREEGEGEDSELEGFLEALSMQADMQHRQALELGRALEREREGGEGGREGGRKGDTRDRPSQ